MRALLLNPKPRRTYWDLRETVDLLGRKALLPPLGLITVASMLPKDWELKLVDLMVQAITEDLWDWSEIVLVTGMLAQKQDMLRLIQEARTRGKTVVAGGPYPTMSPEELTEAGAHFVFCGEAESGLEELLHRIEACSSEPIVQAAPTPDLTMAPIPRYDLVCNAGHYVGMSVQTTRGCPFECEFCDVINLHGRKPRHKKPDQVIAELSALHILGWRGLVFVSDDNFIGSKKYARELLELLIPWIQERGEPFNFITQASVNLGQDRGMIDLMTSANFGHVFLGIETPDEESLKHTRKFQNLKNSLSESVANICANGLSIVGSFVIGFDGEKPGADERIIEFVTRTHMPMVVINTLEVAPGTALWKRLQSEQRLVPRNTEEHLSSGWYDFIPTRPKEQIAQEVTDARNRLYDPAEYMSRAYEYYLAMRPTRKATASAAGGGNDYKGIPDRNWNRNWRYDLRGLAVILWKRGIVSRHRRQFWTQLWGMWRRNPSRLSTYMNALGYGESLYALRRDGGIGPD